MILSIDDSFQKQIIGGCLEIPVIISDKVGH